MDTIVFDLDGTLVDSLPDIIASFRRTFLTLELSPPEPAEVKAEIGKPLDEMYARFADEAYIPDLVAAYRQDYPQHFTDHSRPYPGVPTLLRDLRERGYTLVVATTKQSSMARAFTDALGLTPLLDFVQGTDDFPHKPAPEVIHRALAAVQGQGVWMVGDTVSDMQAGKAAGLKTYAVSWGTHSAETLAEITPDRLEPNLDALLALLPERRRSR